LNSQNDKIFQKLESLDRFFLVSSDDEKIYSKIESSQKLRPKSFSSQGTLVKKILDFTLQELNITPETFADIQQRRFEQAEKMLQDLNFKEVPNFLAARANTANIYQLLSLDKPELLKIKAVKGQERVKTLLDTSLTLGILSQHLKFPNEESLPDNLSLPTIILSYPFFNPDYRELIKEIIDETGGDERSIAKQMRYLRFVEQDIETYDYTVNLESKTSNIDPNLLISSGALKQNHTLFLDFVGYLHSTFELSPYIRVPARGASLNTYISRLSPSQYRKTQNSRSLGRNLAQIGKAISSNLPSQVVDFLGRYADGIFAISDLPLEWLLVQDIPLAFLCDVCRVPETSSTSILAQFNINCRQFFQINKNILRKTLVVCGATSEEPIFKNYEHHVSLQKTQDLPYNTAHIESKDKFFETVNKLRPHLLIIDSHGDFKKQSEGSYIWLGNEKLTGKDIVEHLPQIPLVILSCCWGTPIYGNANTIAQAFFETGSFSVLSTFLPISVKKGFILYFRILNNLSYAASHGMHESWMNFISHNIRTSYIDDVLDLVFEKFSFDILERDKYASEERTKTSRRPGPPRSWAGRRLDGVCTECARRGPLRLFPQVRGGALLDVVVQRELVRVRPQADRVDLDLALVGDPRRDEVLGEDPALEQVVVVGLERVEHGVERRGHLRDVGELVRRQLVEVLVDRGRRLDLVADAVEAGHEHRREREVGVARRVGAAELEALGLGVAAGDRDADAGRAVALAVDQVDRGLEAGHQAVVAVDRRVGERQQRRRVVQQAADVVAGGVGQARRSRPRRRTAARRRSTATCGSACRSRCRP
jgi:hypothetical protein